MFPAASMAGGKAVGPGDVCIDIFYLPISYENTGTLTIAVNTAPTVLIQMMPVVVLPSNLPSSEGDEEGVNEGVISGEHMEKIQFTQASSKVFAAGNPVVYLGCTTVQNDMNVTGTLTEVTQQVVLVAP